MPVRYDIAAQIPQYSGGGMDPMNMMVQLQGMDYRQRQNALADIQMQKMQQELQQQNALRGVLSNLDVTNPTAVGAISRTGNLSEALSVLGAQRQAETQRATAGYHTGMLDISRAKLPLEQEELRQKSVKEARLSREALAKADKADLDMVHQRTAMAQDILSRMIGDEANYQTNLDELYKFDPKIATHLPQDKYNEGAIKRYMNTAESLRTQIAKEQDRRAKSEEVSTTMPDWAKGYVLQTTPGGGARLVAPQQPGARMPDNMMTPAMPGQNAFTNAPAPTMAAPEPADVMGTPQYDQRRSSRSMLDVAGVDMEKGTNHVADLIRDTPSSAFRAYAQQKEGGFKGKATPQMENVGRLNAIIENMIEAATGGKLGGGISNADVDLLRRAKAEINNSAIQPNQRMAAWDEVMRIHAKRAGFDYTPMTAEQIRGEPIIGQRKPAQVNEQSILTDIFGAKK